MSKHRPAPAPAPSPAQRIAEAERIIGELEAKHQAAVERAAEYAGVRDRLSYAAHAQQDPEAGDLTDILDQSDRDYWMGGC